MPTIRFYDRDVEVGIESLRTCNLCLQVVRAFDTADGRFWVILNRDHDVSHVATCPHYAWELQRILLSSADARAHVMPEDGYVASRAEQPAQPPEWAQRLQVAQAESEIRYRERLADEIRRAEAAAYREDARRELARQRKARVDEWWARQKAIHRYKIQREAYVAEQGGWPPAHHTDVPLRILFGQERPGDRELLREIAP